MDPIRNLHGLLMFTYLVKYAELVFFPTCRFCCSDWKFLAMVYGLNSATAYGATASRQKLLTSQVS